MGKIIYAKFCICQICGKEYWVKGKRALISKYCSKECANIGQPLNRIIWNKGLTKNTDERMYKLAKLSKKNNKMRGIKSENHPFYGKHHTEESKRKISENNHGWQNTEKQIKALDKGRDYFRGLTKETCPAIKRRAEILSKLYKGKKNPEHSKKMKIFYQKYPEKHPNYICAQNGHITKIENIIKEELEKRNIPFIFQYPLNGFFLDFAIIKDNLKIDVECDGEYFHKDKSKDNIRDYKIRNIGWKIIRLKEKDIINTSKLCVDRIERNIKGGELSTWQKSNGMGLKLLAK